MTDPAADIQQATQAYARKAADHAYALRRRIKAKHVLENALADARRLGQIEGKNEADREAHARQLFADLYTELESAESDLAMARAQLDIAAANLQTARDLAALQAGFPLGRVA